MKLVWLANLLQMQLFAMQIGIVTYHTSCHCVQNLTEVAQLNCVVVPLLNSVLHTKPEETHLVKVWGRAGVVMSFRNPQRTEILQ